MVKKALLVGINYIGQNSELRGCINDVRNVYNTITQQYNYDPENIKVLVEEPFYNLECDLPTRINIITGMRWLTGNTDLNDKLFFHYSGHGSQMTDYDGDEKDHMDETIVPLDYASAGDISDDKLVEYLVDPVPEGVQMRIILDCCHSGSGMDLRYNVVVQNNDTTASVHQQKYFTQEQVNAYVKYISEFYKNFYREYYRTYSDDYWSEVQSRDVDDATSTDLNKMPKPMKKYYHEKKDKAKRGFSYKLNYNKKYDESECDVIMISGCKDTQTSADAYEGGDFTGALTHCLLEVLKNKNYRLSNVTLLRETRNLLLDKDYTQVPQMSSGQRINLKAPFTL